MCFTPAISFAIFAIEWILGLIVLWKRRNAGRFKEAYGIAACILFFLGFYQFTQGMFCLGNVQLWGLAGFLTYTFLPAMGVHFAYVLLGKKDRKMYWIYSFPILFSLIAVLTPNFVKIASCSRYFIVAQHSWSDLLRWIYGIYYFGFIIYTAYLCSQESKRDRKDRKMVMAGLVGIFAFTIPTFILIILFPALEIGFPSILCEFALLFAVCLFYMIHLIEKKK